METLVREVSAKLGVHLFTARRALGILLAYVRKWLSASDWNELVSKLPYADKTLLAANGIVVDTSPRITDDKGIIVPLHRIGLAYDQIPLLIVLFLDFVKTEAGPHLAERILSAVPSLKLLASLDVDDEPSDSSN